MASNTQAELEPVKQPRSKLRAKIPEALLATWRANCAEKTNLTLIGRIQGKHPGLRNLTAWAHKNLHSSFAFLSLKANNMFEVTFTLPEGRIHALTQADLICETTPISFSSWRPHFKTSQAADQLDFPVWMQIVDLCQILREESFLRTIGEQIGQVIAIDNSDAYRAKLFGPRVRILVRDLDDLPPSAIIPRLDGEGEAEYILEFSGLPNHCGRCRSRDHQVRHCPKRDLKQKSSEQRRRGERNPTWHRPHIPPTTTETQQTRMEPAGPDKGQVEPLADIA